MSWEKVKTVILIVLIILISEGIRLYTGIPITLIDIIIFPITCVLIYFIKFYTSPFSNNSINTQQSTNAWELVGFVFFVILLTIMGVWITWIGIQDPLQYFSSVKGGGHGYTLIQVGAITALYSVWFALKCIYRLIRLHQKSA